MRCDDSSKRSIDLGHGQLQLIGQPEQFVEIEDVTRDIGQLRSRRRGVVR